MHRSLLVGLFVGFTTILAPSVTDAATRLPNGVSLKAGSTQVEEQHLVAGPEGALYSLPGNIAVFLHAGSRARFESTVKLTLGKPSDPLVPARVIVLKQGRADVTVPNDPTRAMMISAPQKLDAVTKAGRSSTIAEGKVVATAALEGDMLVAVDGKWKPLLSGNLRLAPSATTEPLLAAPTTLAVERSLLLKRGSTAPTTRVRWAAVPKAVSYLVSVAPVQESAEPLFEKRAKSPEILIENLEPGSYQVRVRAIDAAGFTGATSEAKTVRVLSMKLPEGAVVADDGTILLGPGQSAELVGSDGLELSYGSLDQFIPAPRWLGLARGRPAAVHLRDPASRESVFFRLEPLEIKAKIAFLSPIWPRRGLPVHIKLFTAGGRTLPDRVVAVPRLTVNTEQIDLKWERRGSTLSTRVPLPTRPGPWVVRVEVTGQSGELLGRDFVELTTESDDGAPERDEADKIAARGS